MKKRKTTVNNALGRFFRRYEQAIIILVSLLPFILMLWISYVWTSRQLEREMSFLADATAKRSENILNVTRANLEQLAEHTHSQCTQATLDYMREKVFSVMYIRETGIINDSKLICNNVALFDPPVEITEIEHRRTAERDGEIAIVPPVPTLQGGKSILVNYRVNARSYVNALIDPDIFQEFHDYVRLGEVSGVFLVREDGKTVVSFGSMSERELPPNLDDSEHLRHYHGSLFSIYKSGQFPIYAVVASSSSFIQNQWLAHATAFSILAVVMSLLLFVVLRKTRRFNSLLQGELWQAIEKDELCVHYQPIMDLTNHRCVGAETLIRWQHPEQGLLMPLVFLPLAEQTGMIRPLTRWLIRRIESECQYLLMNHPDLHISLNLSSYDLGCDGHKASFEDLLFQHIPHEQVIYEITEQNFIPDHALTANDVIQSLRKKGAKVALDDFGTGYSSLSYLHRFPVDYLKIDKVFVDGIFNENSSSSLIDHIISIAHSMNCIVTAEGIEHSHQLQYLREKGVKYGQGWYFSKPLPLDKFIDYLDENNGFVEPCH